MRTRRASPADLAAVAAIAAAQPRSAGWSQAQFEASLSSRALFLVRGDAQVRAYAVFVLVAPEAQLVDLAVDPSCARQGQARGLLDDAIALLEGDGYSKVTLEVSETNAPARRLYQALGFVVVGRRQKFYTDGSDAILMDLTLT